MNANPKPSSAASETALRERSGTLRSAVGRQPRTTPLDACLADARSYAERFNFAPFSIWELARLYEITKHADEYWGQVGSMPLCGQANDDGPTSLTNLGWFVELEESRMGLLRDRCVAEIARRVPADDAEQNQILCVRIAHEMDCNGLINRQDVPGLLIEALKAWG